jgi:hypothetical protein
MDTSRSRRRPLLVPVHERAALTKAGTKKELAMATVPGSPNRGTRPKQATPAERAVEFAAQQAKLKQEAADRREAKERQTVTARKPRPGRRA